MVKKIIVNLEFLIRKLSSGLRLVRKLEVLSLKGEMVIQQL